MPGKFKKKYLEILDQIVTCAVVRTNPNFQPKQK